MRTTLSIDDDLFRAAKALAESRSAPIGTVISELIRKGLKSEARLADRGVFPVFTVSPGARPITLGDTKRSEDEP